MAHHSSHRDPDIENMFAHLLGKKETPLGATGLFPEGKLTDSDEGETRIAIGHKAGKVVIDLGTPTTWIGFTPEQARDIASLLIRHAREAESPE